MQVRDIMTNNPSCVTVDATAREAADLMRRNHVGLIPVVRGRDDHELVGVVTDRDIAVRCVAEGLDGACLVRDVMSSSPLTTCSADEEVDVVMQAMSSEKVRRIPITDERNRLVGIVSQADIIRKSSDRDTAQRAVSHISEPGGKHTT